MHFSQELNAFDLFEPKTKLTVVKLLSEITFAFETYLNEASAFTAVTIFAICFKREHNCKRKAL